MTGRELINAIEKNHLLDEEVHPESLLKFTAKNIEQKSVAYQTLHMNYLYFGDSIVVKPGEMTYCGFAERYK